MIQKIKDIKIITLHTHKILIPNTTPERYNECMELINSLGCAFFLTTGRCIVGDEIYHGRIIQINQKSIVETVNIQEILQELSDIIDDTIYWEVWGNNNSTKYEITPNNGNN